MRLTEKHKDNYYYPKYATVKGIVGDQECNIKVDIAIWNKLGEIEDVEDELGIDLRILIKAIRIGIKAKWENNEIVSLTVLGCFQLLFNQKCFQLIDYNGKKWFYYFKDYGKTWALTEEELEK